MTTVEAPTTKDQGPSTSSDQPSTVPIEFGTDGWRAVIADDFTFDNVRRVAGAIASYVLKHEDPTRGVVVGYDTRFGSPGFARAADLLILDKNPLEDIHNTKFLPAPEFR